tara:strand:- start:437 stop:1339 length:903 start_codon:yes stop_codon:yes gene_type:complete
LKDKLLLVKNIREFGFNTLKLKKTNSYSTYLDIGRQAVVWNVVATKQSSLDLKEWCYLFIGCFSYRGFYSREEAVEYAEHLVVQENLQTAVLSVPAYSTLGWSDFFGGDPVLNTFLWDDKTELVRLLFHELAHHQIFIKNDTIFNESFASFVEDVGSSLWIKKYGDEYDLQVYKQKKRKRLEVSKILSIARQRLKELYARNLEKDEIQLEESEIFQKLRTKLEQLTETKELSEDYQKWISQINTAWLAAFSLYEGYKPFFHELFIRNNSDWVKFYKEVKKLEKIKKSDRDFIIESFLESE